MQGWLKWVVKGVFLFSMSQTYAAQTAVEVFLLNEDPNTQGIGESIGTIEFTDSDKGLVIKPNLKGLPPGPHGFHIHEKDSCQGETVDGKYVKGSLAGGHLDPAHTEQHLGPNGKGHHGDLPVLNVDKNGEAKEKLVAPHLTVLDLRQHSVMIHEHGDNYSDKPEPLGGGGPRIACGVFS
jgi:Cu-Zn family superoxide dismutase